MGQDTDGDGTPDHLDTDSDGDGCTDALEAGFTDANEDGEVDGTGYNANGTVSGSDGYTDPLDSDGDDIKDYLDEKFLDVCLEDSDGDGVVDLKDLDDDNDGIYDTDECAGYNLLVDQNFENRDVTRLIMDNADGSGWTDLFINGIYSVVGDFDLKEGLTNEAIYTRVFSDLTIGDRVVVSLKVRNAMLATSADNVTTTTLQLIDANGVEQTQVLDLSTEFEEFTIELTATATELTFNIILADGKTDYHGMGGNFSYKNIYVDDIVAETQCQDQDTDNDGTPDHLDTDADGDGCYDVVEAGFTDANNNGQVDGTGINANGTVAGSDGYVTPADVDNNGIADFLQSSPTITITCSASINAVASGSSANVTITNPNHNGLSINGERSDGLNLDDPYAGGTTTITWTAINSCGESASCTQDIVVTCETITITCLRHN